MDDRQLVILRLGYRITHAPMRLPADVPPWQQAAAHATHWALDRLFVVHGLIAATIACLATVHIGAALYHHFVRRDAVLMRMIAG